MAIVWDAQAYLPTEISSAFWAALSKLEQAQYNSSTKNNTHQGILGSFGNLEKFYNTDNEQYEKPKGNKQPNRRIVVLMQFL